MLKYLKALSGKSTNLGQLRGMSSNSASKLQFSKLKARYKLSEEAAENLSERARVTLKGKSPYKDLKLIKEMNFPTKNKKFSLDDFESDTAEHGYPAVTLIEGLPIGKNLPNTPDSEETPKEKDFISENVMIALASAFNSEIYLNEGEKNNSPFQNVMHLPQDKNKRAGTNSKLKLGWHIENIHELTPPDFITLLALRGDKNAYTKFILLEEIIDQLPELVIQALSQPDFAMRTGATYHAQTEVVAPILHYQSNEAGWRLRFNGNQDRCEALSEDSEKALSEFSEAVTKTTVHQECLKSGDALILNNRKVLHDRHPFERSTSFGERRWLQRSYQRSLDKVNFPDEHIAQKEEIEAFKEAELSMPAIAACNSSMFGGQISEETTVELQLNLSK